MIERIFSQAALENLIERGFTVSQISKELNCTKGKVFYWIKKYKLKVKNKRLSISLERQEEIVALYKSGFSMVKVAKKLGISADLVFEAVKRMGVARKLNDDLYRKYSIKRDFFKQVNTEQKAYFLGLLYTDGCLSKRGYSFHISLQNQDSYMVDWMAQCLYNNVLEEIKFDRYDPSQKRITFSDKEVYSDLLKLGLFPNKSLILKFPSEKIVPLELRRHFMRGVFDGDGCAHISKKDILITSICGGSFDFITEVYNELNREIGAARLSIRPVKGKMRNPLYMVTYCRRKLQLRLYHYLYDDATIFLKRKKKKFEEFFQRKDIII